MRAFFAFFYCILFAVSACRAQAPLSVQQASGSAYTYRFVQQTWKPDQTCRLAADREKSGNKIGLYTLSGLGVGFFLGIVTAPKDRPGNLVNFPPQTYGLIYGALGGLAGLVTGAIVVAVESRIDIGGEPSSLERQKNRLKTLERR